VAAWIDFCFRSTLSFSLTSEMKTENSLLRKEWSSWERCSIGKVAMLARRRTGTVITPILDGNGAFASAVLGKEFPFITATGL
jgi:hypothetical protein